MGSVLFGAPRPHDPANQNRLATAKTENNSEKLVNNRKAVAAVARYDKLSNWVTNDAPARSLATMASM